jgi:acetylornithine deacetylase
MKGFIAVVTSALLSLDVRTLSNPIYFAVTYDEEVGCIGVKKLVDHMKSMEVLPYLCIVGEPTMMELCIGHKGSMAYSINVKSRPAHSSFAPLEVNSIEVASEIVHKLSQLGKKFEVSGPFETGYRIPFATVHTGVMKGGVQVNIIPDLCHFQFEVRTLASQDVSSIEEQIISWIKESEQLSKEKVPSSGIDIIKNYGYPGLETRTSASGYRLALDALDATETEMKVAFGTEAGSFQEYLGICSVVCGPGDIAQAHQADEYVTQDQIRKCQKFISRLIFSSQEQS